MSLDESPSYQVAIECTQLLAQSFNKDFVPPPAVILWFHKCVAHACQERAQRYQKNPANISRVQEILMKAFCSSRVFTRVFCSLIRKTRISKEISVALSFWRFVREDKAVKKKAKELKLLYEWRNLQEGTPREDPGKTQLFCFSRRVPFYFYLPAISIRVHAIQTCANHQIFLNCGSPFVELSNHVCDGTSSGTTNGAE